MVVTAWPSARKAGNQAAVHRLAVDQHGAGAAIAGVAALLDAEMSELAQERAQALPGARGFAKTPCR